MKKIIATMLCVVLLIAGCSVTTKSEAVESNDTNDANENTISEQEPVILDIVTHPMFETEANVVRDQLIKSGFDVDVSLIPDWSGLYTALDSRDWDIYICSWRTLNGSPDYAVRSLYRSDGSGNKTRINDAEIDRLIDLAATQLQKEAVTTYSELEKRIVEDMAYYAPLNKMQVSMAVDKNLIDPETVEVGKSKYMYWTELDYNDPSLRDTTPLITTQRFSLGHFDLLTSNGTYLITVNSYVRLIEFTNDDKITTDSSLSHNYAIKDGNSEFYFILRDNVNFSKVDDTKAVDSGIRVGAEDVVFSLDRARSKDSVPGHRAYTSFKDIESVEIVTDLSELEQAIVSGGDLSIKEALESGIAPITELAADKSAVDNAAGKYQVVKVTTNRPFPQILNNLADFRAGIVYKDHVSEVNDFDVAAFDPTKDSRYGDVNQIMEGPTFSNELYCSGPYTILYANDYEVVSQRNPGFMPGTEFEANIKDVTVKLIGNTDASISALRSGEIHHVPEVPSNLLQIVKNDPNLSLTSNAVNGLVYAALNTDEDRNTSDVDVRKAILYSIDQQNIITSKDGAAYKGYSTLTMVDTGNTVEPNAEYVITHLQNYFSK
jgi:peptide/nickel transport system substrate-binding protein